MVMVNKNRLTELLMGKLENFNIFYDITYSVIKSLSDDKQIDIIFKRRENIIKDIKNIDNEIRNILKEDEKTTLVDIIYSQGTVDNKNTSFEIDTFNITKEIKSKVEDILSLDRKVTMEMGILKESALGNIKNLKKNRHTTKYLDILGSSSMGNTSIRYDKV